MTTPTTPSDGHHRATTTSDELGATGYQLDQSARDDRVDEASVAARPVSEGNPNRVDFQAGRPAPTSAAREPEEVLLPKELPDRATVVARQKERFGGVKIGSAFFGWLAATGLAVILIALLAAAGVAFGVATNTTVDQAVQESQNATGTAKTVGLVGGILLLVILFGAYYGGGYVAGRMARFNGLRQGVAVWLWGIVTALVIAAIAAIAGSQYDIFAKLNLPRLPVNEGSVTTAGLIAIGAAILAALIGAMLGGLAGMRFHRKVDAAGLEVLDN